MLRDPATEAVRRQRLADSLASAATDFTDGRVVLLEPESWTGFRSTGSSETVRVAPAAAGRPTGAEPCYVSRELVFGDRAHPVASSELLVRVSTVTPARPEETLAELWPVRRSWYPPAADVAPVPRERVVGIRVDGEQVACPAFGDGDLVLARQILADRQLDLTLWRWPTTPPLNLVPVRDLAPFPAGRRSLLGL